MSESNQSENTEFKPKTKEMSREDFMNAEHQVQTGATDVLPDGRTIGEVQKTLSDLQKKQEKELLERDEKRRAKQAQGKTDAGAGDDFLKQKVEVAVAENGATIASPVVEKTVETPSSTSDEPENDLPADLPGRRALLAAGITSLEKVASFDRETLLGIPGIKDATADKVLSYGKS